MNTISNNNQEIYVANCAIQSYRKMIAGIKKQEEFLTTKKFHLSDIVIKKGTSYFDNVFGTAEGSIGKIVGWDFENNYYRVFYSKSKSYIGVVEDNLEKYNGSASDEIINHNPFEIDQLIIHL